MKSYSKPEFEFVKLTAEEKFASGSSCIVVGACPDPNKPGDLLMEGPFI